MKQRGDEVRAALAARHDLAGLTEILRAWKVAGVTRDEARSVLERLRGELDDTDEDRVLEMLDIVEGFCSPDQRVWS